MTISEIAAKAGVSAATVSRVLNGKGHVKDSTRQQILHVIRQNENVPSEIARGLSKSDSNNIGVFVTDIENPFFSKAVRGIAEKADLYGYNVFLFNTDEDPEKEHRYLQTVLGLRIKGLIIAPVFETDDETRLRLQRMQERGVPVVLLDRDIRGLPLDGVFSEDEEGAYQAVRSLILAGHRRIAIVTGPDYTRPGRERTAGYRRALEEFGLPLEAAYIRHGNFRSDLSYLCTKELLHLPQPPTAVFCASNMTTIGALKYLSEQRLQVGRDISIISFDHVEYLDCVGLSLTAVERSYDEMGRQAMELLQKQLTSSAKPAGRTRVYQKTTLDVQGSEQLASLSPVSAGL